MASKQSLREFLQDKGNRTDITKCVLAFLASVASCAYLHYGGGAHVGSFSVPDGAVVVVCLASTIYWTGPFIIIWVSRLPLPYR
jgi:hypothetical protein